MKVNEKKIQKALDKLDKLDLTEQEFKYLFRLYKRNRPQRIYNKWIYYCLIVDKIILHNKIKVQPACREVGSVCDIDGDTLRARYYTFREPIQKKEYDHALNAKVERICDVLFYKEFK